MKSILLVIILSLISSSVSAELEVPRYYALADIAKAETYLLKSGKTPGSPQLNSFGPNMSLAKELLEAERLDVVLEYFKLCANFWEMSGDRLEVWAILAQNGKIPNFGANLVY